jgi:betaine-aldehyde dehydrogenase
LHGHLHFRQSAANDFPGTPFGGYKQSGIGREECLEELISYTQEKNIHIGLPQPNADKIPA